MIYGPKSDGTYVVESEVPHGTSGTISPAGPLIASDSPWRHCACLVPPKQLAGVGYICQSCLPDSRDRFDCLPLGPVASQAVQGPAGLAEPLS